MYGMVNKAIEDLVLREQGPETWDRVRERAAVEVETFVSNQAYPDELTYRLVAAASEQLGRPATEVLHRFGVHWILHTAPAGYEDLMDAGGSDLAEFLENLPAFHTRISLILPELVPPTFRISDRRPGSLMLHYRSEREGLEPFVEGLLDGLGQRFGTPVRVRALEGETGSADRARFHVQWGPDAGET